MGSGRSDGDIDPALRWPEELGGDRSPRGVRGRPSTDSKNGRRQARDREERRTGVLSDDDDALPVTDAAGERTSLARESARARGVEPAGSLRLRARPIEDGIVAERAALQDEVQRLRRDVDALTTEVRALRTELRSR